ncbi:hypothetical protein MRX96_041442 [Rhipicephalus microplus]
MMQFPEAPNSRHLASRLQGPRARRDVKEERGDIRVSLMGDGERGSPRTFLPRFAHSPQHQEHRITRVTAGATMRSPFPSSSPGDRFDGRGSAHPAWADSVRVYTIVRWRAVPLTTTAARHALAAPRGANNFVRLDGKQGVCSA